MDKLTAFGKRCTADARRYGAVATVVAGVVALTGCGEMSRADLQDAIQSDINKKKGRFAVEAVHCKKDDSSPTIADYQCIVVISGQSGGPYTFAYVNVSGDSWSVVGKPVISNG